MSNIKRQSDSIHCVNSFTQGFQHEEFGKSWKCLSRECSDQIFVLERLPFASEENSMERDETQTSE